MSKSLVVIGIALIIAAYVGVQYFCVRVYAPWMLGSNDIQAIAYMCSPNQCN
jgi:hypothetical protein